MTSFQRLLSGIACILLFGCSSTSANDTTTELSEEQVPPNMFIVSPIEASGNTEDELIETHKASELSIGQGRFFSYALPEGWQLGENGQFALTLMAPDKKALTLMVGNTGLPNNYPPAQFVYEKLAAINPENLQISEPQQATPVKGFQSAYEYDVSYSIQGVPCKGRVKCHIAPSYDLCVMAMTAALSDASQWDGYSSWLPLVAEQISATDGAAFGMRGIMQQNLQNSTAYAEAARQYREWSQKNWQQVTDERGASIDRQNAEFRENIGGVQSYTNPYNNNTPVELPTTYKYYWIDKQGVILGTDDPSVDPNAGSTGGEWSQMKQYQRQ